MKKIIFVFILLFSSQCFAWTVQDAITAQIIAMDTLSCTASATMTNSGVTAFDWLMTNADTEWQEVKNSDSVTICRISVYLDSGSDGTVHIEIWDVAQTGQIGGDSDTVSLTSRDAQNYSFVWTVNPKPDITTDFVIIFSEDSGTQYIPVITDPDSYEDTDYDIFITSTDRDHDAVFTVYTQ